MFYNIALENIDYVINKNADWLLDNSPPDALKCSINPVDVDWKVPRDPAMTREEAASVANRFSEEVSSERDEHSSWVLKNKERDHKEWEERQLALQNKRDAERQKENAYQSWKQALLDFARGYGSPLPLEPPSNWEYEQRMLEEERKHWEETAWKGCGMPTFEEQLKKQGLGRLLEARVDWIHVPLTLRVRDSSNKN